MKAGALSWFHAGRLRFRNWLRSIGRRLVRAGRWALALLMVSFKLVGGWRGLFIIFGLACLFKGASEVWHPLGYLAVGGVLLWMELRRPQRSVKVDQVLDAVMAALERRQA